ncbi:phage tail tape measure protein [Enterobacter hormaechei]|uniref:phage tail tape measure protein n=1 Tax=Enterobacter cloacae complex TaxID=354276 RepID=UPI000650B1CE|nr:MULTISPECIES: phage tail tape measure protein [Enterobacter cloacae complex]EHF4963771.1 phage tail tape measure protein [Enterobacter hormaechei]AOP82342.1 phage tail tape measure protein [Enterobacter hormaechei subsp. oharae]EHF4977151.1 phage tail tape measure protein [Enterobacter hormaechei]EHF4987262.1 phage tail tape measure protein [Enterobacter hormaechei]EHF5050803.1 phage tail tape measure protein [Enterobacter hormaechei]
MTDQIASITLRADVSDLKTASNELDKLGQAAAGAVDKADDLNSVFRAGAESAKQGSEGLKEQQSALKGLLENIDPVTKALNRLDEQQESLRKFQAKGFLDTDTFQAYNKILDDTRLKLTDTGEAAARAQAELAATQAAEKQSAALKNLLGSIDPTIRAFNSLDEQHAQLVAHFEAGRINGAQFEHFNTILNQTRERLSGVADVLPEALSRQEAAARRAGISVGQYSAAMRTLPAQFTDIATQLAGGQSPFLILLQQGGQIKDQFGSVQGALSGVGEYIRSMAGMINPTTIALGGLIGTIGLLAAAAYNSSEQFEQVARSVIMMGGAGFSTMQQLNQAAEEVAGKTNTSISSTVDTLVTLNDTGKYTASQMKQIATAITLMGKAGNDTKTAMADFGKIVSDPVKGLASLNEQYGFVDEAMIKHIIQLRKQKGEQAAVTEAINLFAGVMEKRAQETIEATDNIGKAWTGLKAFASDTFGQIGITVRAWGNQVIEVFKLLSTSFEALFVKMKEVSLEIMGGMITGFTDIANKLPGGETLIKSMGFDGLAESVARNREAASKEYTQLTAEYNKHIANLSKSQWQWEEEAKNGLGGGVKGTGSVDRQTKDAVSKLAEDSAKKTKEAKATLEAGDRTLENYRAQARTLTETLETLRQTGETHAKNTEFSKQQSRFAELDEAAKTRALTAQEKSLLSSREAILNAAKVVDQKNKEVEAQQKINGLAQQANKYVTQMSEKTDALRDSAGLSSRQTQRMMEEAQLRQGWLNGGGKLDDAGYKKELAALRKYYAEEDKLRGDWKAGAVAGWNEYLDAATNTYDAVKNVASSTLTGLSNMLTELMTTGTASVKEFGKSMLKMILEITNQLIVAYTVQAAMGWISGGSSGGSTPGGSYANAAAGLTFNAKGGVYDSPGLSKYVNGVYDSPQYFTFQGASKFAKGGVFAEAGAEAIMPLTRDSAGRLGVRAQGGGGMAPVINTTVNVDAGGSATVQSSSSGDAMGRALADEMQNAALQVIQKHLKPGGMIYNFSKGR